MATNTAGNQGQMYHTNQVHYLAKTITKDDAGKTVTIGYLPPGAVVIPGISGVAVNVVFNGDSTNTVDVGIVGTTTKYSSALALGTLGWIEQDVLTESAGSAMATTAEEKVIATVVSTANPTTGSATVILAYVIPEDVR
jgi:hypothetical protein